MNQYKIEIQLPCGEWVLAYYPAYVTAPFVTSLSAAESLVEVMDSYWNADISAMELPIGYRIVEVDS